jgi:hypothetical protein
MKPYRIVFLAIACAASLGAQTANVIELSPEDSKEALKVWLAKVDADAKWEIEQTKIGERYTHLTHDNPIIKDYEANLRSGGTHACYLNENVCIYPGFETGFEFSKDFKYIVPKPLEPPMPQHIQLGIMPTGTGGTLCTECNSVR